MNVREPTDRLDLYQRQAGRSPESIATEADMPPANWPNRALSMKCQAGGLSWHLQRGGRGTPALLLHGTGASAHSWGDFLPLLAEHHDVLAPDLPGHGFSEPLGGAKEPPTLPGMARALAALLEELDFAPRVIIGHSAGAALALQLALTGAVSPALVIGLNAALEPYGGFLAPIAQPLARAFAVLTPVSGFIAARARQPGTVERLIAGTGSTLQPGAIAPYRELLGREAHVAATLAMMAHWDVRDMDRRLGDLVCPLCLIVGEADRTVPPTQATRISSRLTRARVLRLAGLGHLAHEERPRQVFNAVLEAERWSGMNDTGNVA